MAINHKDLIVKMTRLGIDKSVYVGIIDEYANFLHHLIRSEFITIDLQDDKNFDDNLIKLKQITASTFNKVSLRVISDILQQKNAEHAVCLFTFWTDIAFLSAEKYHNLQLEWAIVSGLTNINIDRIFGMPDKLKGEGKPAFKRLSKETQKEIIFLRKANRRTKQFTYQSEYFPPLAQIFGDLDKFKEWKNQQSYDLSIMQLINIKSKIPSHDFLENCTLNFDEVIIDSMNKVEEDCVWQRSTELRTQFSEASKKEPSIIPSEKNKAKRFNSEIKLKETKITLDNKGYNSAREISPSVNSNIQESQGVEYSDKHSLYGSGELV